MGKKAIDLNGSATQMVGNINDNFDELYKGAGGGSASLPTKRVKVYDVMTRAGNGVNQPATVAASIKTGTEYYIEKSQRGSNWSVVIVQSDTGQTFARETNGTGAVNYDTPIAATQDGNAFVITTYNTGHINIYHYEDVVTVGKSRWFGKRWLLLGDSISTEYREYAGSGYGENVARSLGMQYENLASSGVTSTAFNDSIDNFKDDYDLITVMLGTNDMGYNCPVGAIGDADMTVSYIARLQYLYEKLRTKFPKSVIAFITPIKRYDVSNERYMTNAQGNTTEPYAKAVKTVCDYYSIPCIDIFNTIDPRTETARTNFFMSASDGTHPNSVGHALFIAPVVEARLREIAPFYFNDWEAQQ